MLARKKSAVQIEIRWILCLYSMQISSFHHDASDSSLEHENFRKYVLEQNFFSWFYFSFSPYFLSAASDHYLIGNNITVAVLGIVIPIGEYSCCLRFLFVGFSLLASPFSACCSSPACCVDVSFLCLAFCVCTICIHQTDWNLYILDWTITVFVFWRWKAAMSTSAVMLEQQNNSLVIERCTELGCYPTTASWPAARKAITG